MRATVSVPPTTRVPRRPLRLRSVPCAAVDQCALSRSSVRCEASRHDAPARPPAFSCDDHPPRRTYLRANAGLRRRPDQPWCARLSSQPVRCGVLSTTRHRAHRCYSPATTGRAPRASPRLTIPIAPSRSGYAVQFNPVYPLSGRGRLCHYAYASGAGQRIKRSALYRNRAFMRTSAVRWPQPRGCCQWWSWLGDVPLSADRADRRL
jgi:hypothetical protein